MQKTMAFRLKKAGMASRNIVMKNNKRCFKSALQSSLLAFRLACIAGGFCWKGAG